MFLYEAMNDSTDNLTVTDDTTQIITHEEYRHTVEKLCN